MENKGFDNIGDYNSTSSNSVLSNAVSDDVGKKYVTGGSQMIFGVRTSRNSIFLPVFLKDKKIQHFRTLLQRKKIMFSIEITKGMCYDALRFSSVDYFPWVTILL